MPDVEVQSAWVEAAMVREEAIRACGPFDAVTITVARVDPLAVSFLPADAPEAVRSCLERAFGTVDWPDGPVPVLLAVSYDGDPLLRRVGALDRADIDGTIKAHLGEIKDCYDAERARLPFKSPRGKVVVKFTIGADGHVTEAGVRSREWVVGRRPGVSDTMEACILDEFRQMTFPEPIGGGVVIVSYPFVFSPF